VSGASSFHHVAAVNETQRGRVAARKANMRQGERTDLAADGGRVSQEGAADLLGVSKGTVQRCKVRDFKFSEVRKFASPLDHHPLRAEHQERDEQRHGGHIARDVPRGVVHALNPLCRRMTIAHRPAHGAQNVILVGLEPSTFADEIVKVDVDLAALAAAADSFRHACWQDHLALVDEGRHGARNRPAADVERWQSGKGCG
jgi:hypothetical protein